MLRLALLAVSVASLGSFVAGCGGCYSRSRVEVDVSIPRDCLLLEVITEAKSCGGPETEHTLSGYNTCGKAVSWPGVAEIPSSQDRFERAVPAQKGKVSVPFTIGTEQLVATYTIPG